MDMDEMLARKIARETDYEVKMSGDMIMINKKGLAERRKKAIKDFEYMRDMAELKALSKHSLEHPLTDRQYERMMFLGKKLGLKK
jgi:hypothetical protein